MLPWFWRPLLRYAFSSVRLDCGGHGVVLAALLLRDYDNDLAWLM